MQHFALEGKAGVQVVENDRLLEFRSA